MESENFDIQIEGFLPNELMELSDFLSENKETSKITVKPISNTNLNEDV